MNNNLLEYSDKSNFESYTGIVLDKENNAFKIIKGMFRDKKDFYEKAKKRGLILRKCFESSIFDWIEDNAPDDVTTYLMFSTAFSKWRGNNVLSDYYVKLLNDIPSINRETRKGDPQSKGKPTNGWFESVMTNEKLIEAFNYEELERRHNARKEDYTTEHTVKVYPVGYNGNIPEKRKNKPFVTSILTRDSATGLKKFNDPKFIRELWYHYKTNGFGDKYPALALFLDDDRHNPDIMTTEQLGTIYRNIVKNVDFVDTVNSGDLQHSLATQVRASGDKVKELLALAKEKKEQGASPEEIRGIHTQIAALNKKIAALRKQLKVVIDDNTIKYTPEEQARMKEIKQQLWDLEAYAHVNRWTPDEQRSMQRELNQELNQIKATAKERKLIKTNNVDTPLGQKNYEDKLLNDISNNRTPVPGNPIHGGSSEDSFLARLDKKHADQAKLQRLYQKMNKQEPVKVINPQKQVRLNSTRSTDYANISKNNLDTHNLQINSRYSDPIKQSDAVSTMNQLLVNMDKGFSEEDVNKMNIDIFKNTMKEKPELESIVDVRAYYNARPSEYYKKLNAAAKEKLNEKPTKTEAAVNDVVSAAITTPQNQDTMVRGGIMSVGGKITEDSMEEAYTHSELNPNLFENDKLKKDVKAALLEVANKFEESLDLPIAPVDIYFTGSCANYNYNDQSDIDLHLVYDFENVGIHAEIVEKYLQAAKKVFNSNYKITIKGIPVEVGAENKDKPLVTSGIYSVLKDQWVKQPNNAEIEIADPDMPVFNSITSKIENAIQSKDSSVIGELWKFLGQLRKDSLAKEGEFGAGNALFKKLRNMGFLTRLKDAYYNSASKELSLESLEDID